MYVCVCQLLWTWTVAVLSLKSCLLLCPLLLSTGNEGLYDNPAMKRTPQGAMKGKDGMEEDIYGGVGEGDGSIYDDTTGGGRGMKHSEEGIYDNPNAKGESSLYQVTSINY